MAGGLHFFPCPQVPVQQKVKKNLLAAFVRRLKQGVGGKKRPLPCGTPQFAGSGWGGGGLDRVCVVGGGLFAHASAQIS